MKTELIIGFSKEAEEGEIFLMFYLAFRRPHFPVTAKTSFKGWRAEMKTSLQNTLEDIKSKEDKDSDIPASRRTRRKLHLDDLLV